ncbi:MAG: ABC transporter permease [Arachnia propionica]|uniref:ABC transporter permease n=1 Tax=Arachnia propionica TaxID=1750 RepID=UPI0027038E54|nr:ABC transporter permease [Arachnia propionica]
MKERLYLRYFRNDLVRNWGVNLALLAILVLSAFLMATGSMVMERLVGGINKLFDEARPPHFLQMHTGEHDPAALERFAADHPEIDSWLIEEMIGYDSAALTWSRPGTGESGSFAESLIDNLFVTQNESFDFLLDAEDRAVQPADGDVYVPVAYEDRFKLRVGDLLQIQTGSKVTSFTVAGFVRDAQMASSLSSATRFVISEHDFATLTEAGGGAPEIIVEYRVTDTSEITGLQTAYEANDSLPRNGQAVTFDMIRLVNAFSDGLVAIALVFASLLLVVIALINLRFVITGTMEDEVRQIGVMRAIGLPARAVTGLYLGKFSLMALTACVLGGLLGAVATSFLSQGIVKNYSNPDPGPATVLVPVVALVLVYLLVVGICRGILRGVRRIEVVGALVQGSTLDEKQTARRAARAARQARRARLSRGRGSIPQRLSWIDLRAELRQWLLIPAVFCLTALLLILPMNLLSTFSSPRFVTYMGAPLADVRADLQFFDEVGTVRDDMVAAMRTDPRLDDIRVFGNVLHEARGPEGWESLRVEVGDHSGDTVEFLSGQRPAEGQIALSVLNANHHEVAVGDALPVRLAGQETTLEVSGIYQDVTSGGRTAKMQGQAPADAVSHVIYADVTPGTDPAVISQEYGSRFDRASIVPMQEYVTQTLSGITDAFRSAAWLSFVFGLVVAGLITGLFLKLRLTRERSRMGVLAALGFSRRELISQVIFKTLVTVTVGTLLGTLLAASLGEAVVSALVSASGLGLARLRFITQPWIVLVGHPLILVAVGLLAAVLVTAGLRRGETSEWLNS